MSDESADRHPCGQTGAVEERESLVVENDASGELETVLQYSAGFQTQSYFIPSFSPRESLSRASCSRRSRVSSFLALSIQLI